MRKIPYYLLKQLPMWMCSNKHFFNDSLTCPICGKPRIPPDLSFYVHNILLPKLSPAEREEWLKYFTTIFSDGFESGNFSAWTGTTVTSGNTLDVISTVKHHGSYGARFIQVAYASDAYAYKSFTAVGSVYARAYFRFASMTLASGYRRDLLMLCTAGGSSMGSVGVYNDGGTYKWCLNNYGSALMTLASPNPTIDTWYCVELYVAKGTGANAVATFWLDGVQQLTNTTGANQWDIAKVWAGGRIPAGGQTSDTTGYFDCVVVADTYIGPEGVQVIRTIIDYLGNLDVKTRIANLYRSKIDYVGLLDTKQRISNLYRIFSEQLGLLESKVKILSKVMKDYIGMVDTKIKTLNKNVIQYIGLSDNKVKSLSRTIIENIKLLDLKLKTLSKNIVQYLGLDGFRYIGGQIVSRIVTEIVTFSDNIKKITNTWRKIRGYFIEDYERWKKKRLLRLLRHYILLESEDE